MRLRVSVALAAYNGERFIEDQICSILKQLRNDDEVVISDDNPHSVMSNLVKDLAKKDNRIKYIEGPCKGFIKNFENAIKHTTGDVVFLCDQDDVWLEDKVKTVMKEFKDGADVVLHNASITDSNLNMIEESFFKKNGSELGLLKNIIKNSYMGCCMAFKSEMKNCILPFPKDIPMHDQWIGIVAEKLEKKIVLIQKPLIYYRKHGNNVTGGKTTTIQKIKWRLNIIKNILRKKEDNL